MPEIILLCYPVPRAALDAARAHFSQFEWREGSPDDAQGIAAATIIYGKTDTELLKYAPRLKWLQSPSAGVEKLADCEAFQRGTFELTNAAGMHESCAQHAFALLLSLSRRIHFYEKTLIPGTWRSPNAGDIPLILSGMTMGVFGLGAIGRRICEIARVFGIKTLGVNRSGVSVPEADETLSFSKIDEILPRCDVAMLILPATRETDDLFNARRLALLPRHCLLVNVGRGNCIDEPALISALKNHTIAAAALDVFKQEPLPADSEFFGVKNALISPHLGGDRPDYNDRAFDIFIENLKRFVNGEPLKNRVVRERGY